MYSSAHDNTETINNNVKKQSDIRDIFELILKTVIILLILLTFVFRFCNVIGDSMCNTLEDGQHLIVSNVFYKPKENDIIVFHQTGYVNEPIVKRVIATGNKWVKIDYDACLLYVSDDEIFDSNDIVDESSYVYFDTGSYHSQGTYTVYVPKGYLFVMGDNRNNSLDSRSSLIGLVDEKTVIGKVIFAFPTL